MTTLLILAHTCMLDGGNIGGEVTDLDQYTDEKNAVIESDSLMGPTVKAVWLRITLGNNNVVKALQTKTVWDNYTTADGNWTITNRWKDEYAWLDGGECVEVGQKLNLNYSPVENNATDLSRRMRRIKIKL
jgi:hypothetical protein